MADFDSWKRENLVSIAHAMHEENKKLREDIEVLLKAWRAEVTERCLAGSLAGSQDRPSPPR
jgi:hypothetical protein